ncbi:MAG: hypothetical protein ACJZ9F_01425 [Rhodospirillaceae bacterium]
MTNKPFSQSELSFAVGPKFQTVWGLREAIVFSLEGIGSSTFFWFALSGDVIGMMFSILAMLVAVLLLLSHLGRPIAAWRAIANIRRSWISRGTAAIGLFVVLAALYLSSLSIPILGFAQAASAPLLFFLIVSGVFILFYPGLAMSASAGIAFWKNANHVSLSFLNGFISGMFIYFAVATEIKAFEIITLLYTIGLLAILGTVISFLIFIFQSIHRGGASALSARTLLKNERFLFWFLSIGLGILLPLVVVVFGIPKLGSNTLIGVACGRIIGDVAFRYAILKVGAFESVV